MPRGNKDEQSRERTIYILLSPKDKKFFVGQCLEDSLRETYRKNLLGERKSTSKLIEEIQPERPCVFVLESFVGTASDAMNLVIVWTKIFIENNYESYNHPNLIEMTERLYIDTQTLYNARKNTIIREIISCKNCAIPKFNHQVCKHYQLEPIAHEPRKTKRVKEIRIMVSEEEYKDISTQAEKLNMQVSPYIRTIAKNPQIVQIDYSAISTHTKEMAEIRNSINRLVFTIEASNNYLPREIESIVNLMDELFQSENKLLKAIRELREPRQ